MRGTFSVPRQTQTAGTAIVAFIPPGGLNRKTKLRDLLYECGATAHTLLFIRELSRVLAVNTTPLAAGGTSIVLERDPGGYAGLVAAGKIPASAVADNLIAANDYIAYQGTTGRWVLALVSAVSTDANGRVTCTIPAIGVDGVRAQSPVMFFGANGGGDTHPADGSANPNHVCTASAVNTLPAITNQDAVIAQSLFCNSGLIILSANATNAGVLLRATGLYEP